jgi:hypothetical protein
MNVIQKEYKRDEFIKFMGKYGVSDEVISNFVDVPETIIKNDHKFHLVITSRWYNIGKTHYEFELNYYSPKLMEYLFSLKVYNDIEISVIHLVNELKKAGLFS